MPVAATLLLAGCASVRTSGASLDGTDWRVAAIDGRATPAGDYQIRFAQGRIGGRVGCNSFGGPYRLAGETLSAGALAATRMACAEPHMTLESRAFAVLSLPMRIRWGSGQRLTLDNAAGVLTLERTL